MTNSSSRSIFISHASKNREIADKLVDLFQTGIGVNIDDIFCTSLEGMDIPIGKDFLSFIKEQIQNPKLVILLLTKEYMRSEFCLAELGASWAMAHRTIPIILPPLKREDLRTFLSTTQSGFLNESNDLNNMRQVMVDELQLEEKRFARWESKRGEFIEHINNYIKNYTEESNSVPIAKFKEVEERYQESIEEMKLMEGEITRQKSLIKQLKQAKDRKEVEKIFTDSSDSESRFNQLTSSASNLLGQLPHIVKDAVFCHYSGKDLPRPGFGENDLHQEIEEAIDNDYLMEGDQGFKIILEDPIIKKALKALDEVKTFTENDISEEFWEKYHQEHNHRLNFESKRFWDANF